MKISIIILSFNNFESTTELCLKFLFADPDYVNWEIIVVDNASDQSTREKLGLLNGQYPNLTIIFNKTNLGFSAGNNIGIQSATGDYIVLLNSDAFAPNGMLGKLIQHFEQDPLLGMIGPVTNAAGNEQCIFTSDSDMNTKIKEGLEFSTNGGSSIYSAYRLDFFCVAFPRKVLDQVGLLDEDFGRGYFEDFDLSLRVRESGLKLGFAEDCFIFHRGSSSFGKVPREVKELMKRNKRLLLQKHGNDILFQHKRITNLSVLSQYLERQKLGEVISGYRFSNRIALANAELPKSWLKRWRYLYTVKALIRRNTNWAKSGS